ncbi:hypothetical protein TNIN_454521 [Trichonephila inaurata madagascariensis]|uniref:Uncharacterized protein n=1 Tax=Trichonephila inaurata madagascariensis TaxID=2747483 RepID=A0A8X6K0F7_9ARAC|nr:hypothetical protein TNIN_454521 [Trichonephila inaurata madagascariensis]
MYAWNSMSISSSEISRWMVHGETSAWTNFPKHLGYPEEAYSPDWIQDRQDKRLSEFLGGPGKRVSEFLGGPGKRISEFLGGPGKRVSEFLGGPGKRVSEFLGGPGKRYPAGSPLHQALTKRVSEFLGGPGKRSDYYDFLETTERR